MISGTGNTAPGLSMITVLLIIAAFCSFGVRVWTKYKKTDTWGLDDTIFTCAFVAAIFQVVAVLFAVHRGYGVAWASFSKSDLDAVEKAIFTAQLLFVLSLGATRASTASFSARVLTMDAQKKRIASGLIVLCGLWTLGSAIAIAVRSPLAKPWETLNGSMRMYNRWLPIEITGVFLDLCSLALSAFFIWQLQMSIAKRLAVCGLFGIRLCILPIIACRLWELHPISNDVVRPNLTATVLAEAEMCFALILASATCLKPFLQPFDPGWFAAPASVDTGLTGNYTGDNNKRANAYYELSGVRSNGTRERQDKKQMVITSVTAQDDRRSDDASDELDLIQPYDKVHLARGVLRPDRAEHQATAFAPATPITDSHPDDDRSHWDGGREDTHHITKAQTWRVTYSQT